MAIEHGADLYPKCMGKTALEYAMQFVERAAANVWGMEDVDEQIANGQRCVELIKAAAAKADQRALEAQEALLREVLREEELKPGKESVQP